MNLTRPEQVVLDTNAVAKSIGSKFFHQSSTAVRCDSTRLTRVPEADSGIYSPSYL